MRSVVVNGNDMTYVLVTSRHDQPDREGAGVRASLFGRSSSNSCSPLLP